RGTASAAPAGCRTTRGVSRSVAVANGAGRSASVTLRRTPGASVRQSPNAAAPVRTRGSSSAQAEAEARTAKTAAVRTARARAFALLRGLLDRHGKRLGPGPRVLGDIEQDALRPVELCLEPAGAVGVRLVHVMLAAKALDDLGALFHVLDQDAEMVQPGVVHAFADLVALEAQNRQVDRAVAQMVPVGERPVTRAHDLEVECLAVEIGHRVRVLGGDGDVAELGHICFSSPPTRRLP